MEKKLKFETKQLPKSIGWYIIVTNGDHYFQAFWKDGWWIIDTSDPFTCNDKVSQTMIKIANVIGWVD
jgi:hypothetical protein